jgi:hypothetical protein
MSTDEKPEERKKYPCIYGLKDDCDARRFVEESLESGSPGVKSEEAKVVENAMKNTKSLQFDDEATARKMGEDLGRSIMGPIVQATRPCTAQVMGSYCSMCPTLIEKNAKHFSHVQVVRPPPGTPGSQGPEKKD